MNRPAEHDREVAAFAEFHATAGEWVQGWIDGRELLVSFPVDWTGEVFLRPKTAGEKTCSARQKAQRAFTLAKHRFEGEFEGLCVEIDNPHPRAKGFATSTMDIAGVIAACSALTESPVCAEELLSLCSSIEPSDGIMFEGLALVDHIRGTLVESLPPPPEIGLLVLIPDRTLDTADYRRGERIEKRVKPLAREFESAYGILKKGLLRGDPHLVAEAASFSAGLQQRVMPREEWALLLRAKEAFGASGIAVAHSGSASALLFASSPPATEELASWLSKEKSGRTLRVKEAKASSGGFVSGRERRSSR